MIIGFIRMLAFNSRFDYKQLTLMALDSSVTCFVRFILNKLLNIVRQEPLAFRLLFGGHGLPWICLKLVPQEITPIIRGPIFGCIHGMS